MRSKSQTRLFATLVAIACISASTSAHAERIRLDLRPRICTLTGNDKQCDTTVSAAWRSSQMESLCLVIADRPEIKQCWENYSKGTYSVALTFNEDLLVELRDPRLQSILASKAIKVIREALEYRRKRRQPWNIIY